MDRFRGRALVIATQHGKDRALAPVLERALGVVCSVPGNIDTDQLGTFTGEIPRVDDPFEAARKKCHLVIDATGADLVLASEGSFGPHPECGFLPAGDELLLLIDQRHGREYFSRDLTIETNFCGQWIHDPAELDTFLHKARFPEHGIILRKSPEEATDIRKGLAERAEAIHHLEILLSLYGRAYAETDMRAMKNPLRMESIRRAGYKLAEKLTTCCPDCQAPGYSPNRVIRGLPCSLCHAPTRSVRAAVWECAECGRSEERPFHQHRLTEDPMFCDLCNP